MFDKKNCILQRQVLHPYFKDLNLLLKDITLHKKWSFPQKIYSVNMTKTTVLGHIYE